VPANVGDINASGTNRLIREGARVALCADDILSQYTKLYRPTLRYTTSASLGRKSDYNGEVLARMGVYSRTEDGYERVPAQALGESKAEQPPKEKAPTRSRRKTQSKVRADKATDTAPAAAKPLEADRSAEQLASLGERERKVFEAIPMDHPVAIDRLQSLGFSTGELLTALSLLEIKGLIGTLPGGLYCRA
jgi:predicted Rossmann fold nucleotide-binding protein DprA/Smf involved in DNA uptake